MANPLIEMCERLAADGLHPTAVHVAQTDEQSWCAEITLADWLALGEGGDLPHHRVRLTLRNLPAGVRCQGQERWPDEVWRLDALPWEMERWVAELAAHGSAPDWARYDGDGRLTYLTKPSRWLPVRKAELGKR